MKVFVVSYDLHEGDDYTQLHELLEAMEGERVLDSVWILSLPDNWNCILIIRELRQVVTADRKVFVAEIKQEDGQPILMEDPRQQIR